MASERIDPLFFGPKERLLFGCHHAPSAGGGAKLGVVIAPPVGHEYLRAHRALAQLAGGCASAGLRALRFDLSSTGDSAGMQWPPSLEDWVGDLENALRELALRTRVPRTGLIGVRLASNLALECASRRAPLATLVLWDPILDTRQFTQSLEQLQQRFAASLVASNSAATPCVDGIECMGYHWPQTLLESVRAWRVPRWTSAPAARVLILESTLSQPGGELALELERSGARVQHERSSGAQPWNEDIDRGLVPTQDLRRIVEFLKEDG